MSGFMDGCSTICAVVSMAVPMDELADDAFLG